MNQRTTARPTRAKRILEGTIAVAALAFLVDFHFSPRQAWSGLLLANFYFLSLALGGAVFAAIQNASSSGWSVAFRRVPEAMTAYLPWGAALTLVLLLTGRGIFPWAAPAARALPNSAYLNFRFLVVRCVVCFAVWIYGVRRLTALSRPRNASKPAAFVDHRLAFSAVFLTLFAFTFTVFAIDWLMALEPRWTSTIYPWYVWAGLFEAGMAAMVLLLLRLRSRGAYPELNEHHFHDLGKYLFAFGVFWAYLWFSQYLLIWYSNLPEETVHYVVRMQPGWKELFWLTPIANFAFVFAALLPAQRKKRRRPLIAACAVILFGHALDLYMLIMPELIGNRPVFDPLQWVVFAGVGAAFLLSFERAWTAEPALPEGDPYLQESLHFEGA